MTVKVPKTPAASPPADPTAYLAFTFKCHPCKLGFKRRGMLVNHLARRHPDVARSSVPELQLPIFRAARDYYCQHCHKVYKSSSKRKAHILKNHPGEREHIHFLWLGGELNYGRIVIICNYLLHRWVSAPVQQGGELARGGLLGSRLLGLRGRRPLGPAPLPAPALPQAIRLQGQAAAAHTLEPSAAG